MGIVDLRKSAIAETDKQTSTYINLEGAVDKKQTMTPLVLSHRDSLGMSKIRPRTVNLIDIFIIHIQQHGIGVHDTP